MSNKSVFKLISTILLFWLFIWTESLLPLVFILVIADSVKKYPYYRQIEDYAKQKLGKNITWLEWFLAIVLSVWFLGFVKNHFVEGYNFKSASMQGTLLSGDVLLVNKLVPGERDNVDNIKIYKRHRGIKALTYKDVIVFNFPEGDTLLTTKPTESYYYLKRLYRLNGDALESQQWKDAQFYKVEDRPRFVKRIFGLPGDTIQIEEGYFFANKNKVNYPELSVTKYTVPKGQEGVRKFKPYNIYNDGESVVWEVFEKDYNNYADKISWLKPDIEMRNYPDPMIFPFNTHFLWNKHFYGPFYIPKKGDQIELTKRNLDQYSRLIKVFEQNTLKVENDRVYVNGVQTDTYRFKMDYYWVMGDNRTHSFDSRYWGLVPENHIIGKVVMIIASKDMNNKGLFNFRKDRFFKAVE